MKKIIVAVLLIAVICTAAGVLVACSNATTQGQLENVWQPYERYTYSVSYKADDGSDASGTYVNEIRHYDAGATVGLGSVELASVAEGYLVTGTLTAGDRTLFNACYYALSSGGSYLVPSATYRKETAEATTTTNSIRRCAAWALCSRKGSPSPLSMWRSWQPRNRP